MPSTREKLKWQQDRVDSTLEALAFLESQIISYDAVVSSEDGTPIHKSIVDEQSTAAYEEVEFASLLESVKEVLDSREEEMLKAPANKSRRNDPRRLYQIMERRLGLFGDNDTHTSIGKNLGITHERVRQLEQIARETLLRNRSKLLGDEYDVA